MLGIPPHYAQTVKSVRQADSDTGLTLTMRAGAARWGEKLERDSRSSLQTRRTRESRSFVSLLRAPRGARPLWVSLIFAGAFLAVAGGAGLVGYFAHAIPLSPVNLVGFAVVVCFGGIMLVVGIVLRRIRPRLGIVEDKSSAPLLESRK